MAEEFLSKVQSKVRRPLVVLLAVVALLCASVAPALAATYYNYVPGGSWQRWTCKSPQGQYQSVYYAVRMDSRRVRWACPNDYSFNNDRIAYTDYGDYLHFAVNSDGITFTAINQ